MTRPVDPFSSFTGWLEARRDSSGKKRAGGSLDAGSAFVVSQGAYGCQERELE